MYQNCMFTVKTYFQSMGLTSQSLIQIICLRFLFNYLYVIDDNDTEEEEELDFIDEY